MTNSIPLSPKKGFTLIELVMTIVIMGIVAVPLSLFIAEQVEDVFYSEGLTEAVNLARCEMEVVSNTAYADLATGTTVLNNYRGYNYNLTKAISYVYGGDATAESLKQVVITVTRSGSAVTLSRIVTYIAKNVTYGL